MDKYKMWANLTSNLDRIKIVFTPMLCRRVCNGGRCYNNCEKGDITTVYKSLTRNSFFFCQIPCLNGGRCIGRDQCWCPSNSTGKFCHLPAPPPSRPTPHSHKDAGHQGPKSPSHSMYTLPLSNQQASLHPSLVNVHIQHPPEAEVQIHQVARVQPGQRQATTEGAHSVQQRSQPGNGHEHTSEHSSRHPHTNGNGHSHTTTRIRQNGHVGRCFQETVDGQCGKPLPGLTKQDDCCGSVGASWGLNKCQKCPTKPVIANGQVECPKGFKRMNVTHCQDINECLLPGICKNAECVNAKGSYRCTCKQGYMLDAARSHCVSDKAVSDQRAACYRSISAGTCSLPLANHLTKQICCCSRVGKAWGSGCDRCPLPESGNYHFKEICPAGHGYTYSRSDVQISLRQLEADELQSTGLSLEEENPTYPQFPSSQPSVPQFPSYPQTPQVPQYPEYPETPQAPQYPLTPQHPFYPARETPRQPDDVNECLNPSICGHGRCLNTEGSYTCNCFQGYKLSPDNKLCDVDECALPGVCLHGRCVNLDGTHKCTCNHGYQVTSDSKSCEDVNECATGNACPAGICINTAGSYTCQDCRPGFGPSADGLRCEDIDECLSLSTCANGICLNSEGSYTCENCPTGYRVSYDGELCEGGENAALYKRLYCFTTDVDECALPTTCPQGTCTNTEGSFTCVVCQPGFRVSEDGQQCDDMNECEDTSLCVGGHCTNTDGSYSCVCPSGLELVDGTHCRDINECLTVMGICGEGDCLNSEGSFSCVCSNGYTTIEGGTACIKKNVDECSKDNVCVRGQCLNTDGSFLCLCEAGFKFNDDTADCEDIDECDNETICGNHGFCENTDGSFRCQCDQGYANPPGDTSRCVDVNECEMSLAVCGEVLCENVDGSFLCICPNDNEEFDPITSQCRSIGNRAGLEKRKECYYNVDDRNFCDNVLSRNITKQECCCTVGSGWGDNCEIHPCPVLGRGTTLCPHGSGLIPLPVSSTQNANECEMFESDICKNGRCSNSLASYTCFCRSGFYYDNIRLECVDYDECEFRNSCENGECVNTPGSFNCFCSPPLVLDSTRRRCIGVNTTEEYDHDVHVDICWQRIEGDNMCAEPLQGRRTTYTECCCLYGIAWSGNCAFCPKRYSEDYAIMCNLPWREGSDSLRERIGYEYDRNEGFEGLRAEECGVLNGCENGRCVRVREGYTCDCFDGYKLDLDKMACIDINECKDISDKVPLCQNGHCTNTDGSYKCTCLPGFVASAKPHKCIPTIPEAGLREAGN
uniref:Latent-transforming growth factor beta-binding protein 1 n=1 Tax=Acanthochromis polyacanthus TaxID=80966 RepID=A0A3Q1EW23_9TELE